MCLLTFRLSKQLDTFIQMFITSKKEFSVMLTNLDILMNFCNYTLT